MQVSSSRVSVDAVEMSSSLASCIVHLVVEVWREEGYEQAATLALWWDYV